MGVREVLANTVYATSGEFVCIDGFRYSFTTGLDCGTLVCMRGESFIYTYLVTEIGVRGFRGDLTGSAVLAPEPKPAPCLPKTYVKYDNLTPCT